MPRSVVMGSGAIIWDYSRPDDVLLYESDLFKGCRDTVRYLSSIEVTLLLHLAFCARLAREDGSDPMTVAACAAHDLHEVYMRDLPTGLKDLLPDYKRIEALWEASIMRRIGVEMTPERAAYVKQVDVRALLAEASYFRHPGYDTMCEQFSRHARDEDVFTLRRTWVPRVDPNMLWAIVAKAIRFSGGGSIRWGL